MCLHWEQVTDHKECRGKSGLMVFEFRLERLPNQPGLTTDQVSIAEPMGCNRGLRGVLRNGSRCRCASSKGRQCRNPSRTAKGEWGTTRVCIDTN